MLCKFALWVYVSFTLAPEKNTTTISTWVWATAMAAPHLMIFHHKIKLIKANVKKD